MLPQNQAQQILLAQALRAAQPRSDVFAQAIARDPSVQYSTVLPVGVQTTPDPAGSLLSQQRTVMALPELVRGLLEGVAAPNQVRQGKLDPLKGAMLTAGAAPAGALLARAPAGSLGMNVFQGGPHRYGPEGAAKSLDHMGKGEGAQAFGYGRYDAQARSVAVDYRNSLTPPPGVKVGQNTMTPFEFQNNLRVKALKKYPDMPLEAVERNSGNAARMIFERAEQLKNIDGNDNVLMKAFLDSQSKKDDDLSKILRVARDEMPTAKWVAPKGNLYKHDLPDEDIARYLDWDKPLSKQPESVRKALEPLGFKADPQGLRDYDNALLDTLYNDRKKALPKLPADPTGEEIYRKIARKFGDSGDPAAKQAASEAFGKAGIPGLKYYDGMSRNAGEGTRNYVTWDQDVLDRMKLLQRNDETFFSNPASAAVPGAAINQLDQETLGKLLRDPNAA